jgi:hypothetical protein
MRRHAVEAVGYGIGLVAAGALVAALAPSCKGACDDKGSCDEYGGPQPSCDGLFHYDGGAICETCAKRGPDGIWRYPDGTVRSEPTNLGSCGGAGGAGGSAGGGAGGNGGSACPASSTPDTDPSIISDECGIFVSPGGTDGTDQGGHLNPLKTIGAGLEVAKHTGHKRLYVCANNGAFTEQLQLDPAFDGIDIYGGFDCSSLDQWTYTGTKARITPANPIGATVTGLKAGATLQDLEITAANAIVPGGSSVGMIVNGSQNVLLRRVAITAGKGADGAKGAPGSGGPAGDQPGDGQKGANASCGAGLPPNQDGGMWGGASTCGSLGGSGGLAFLVSTKAGDSGAYGLPQANVTPADQQNGGPGATTAGANGSPGGSGANGNSGTNGVQAPTIGTFSAGDFTPADGLDGTDGFPGQGGGGGGASKGNDTCIGASGGSGGMGGCGGKKGAGGKGGGASVALLSLQSGVTLDACDLVAGDGGKGGDGGNAGDGGAGGPGAAGGLGGTGIGAAGRGGDGGQGGPAGSGSGGTGGPSFAIVYDQPPTISGDGSLKAGPGGPGGAGGSIAGSGVATAPSGSPGLNQDTYTVSGP